MLITIGMATYDDFYGVVDTVQALRLYHPTADLEIIVVDNNPSGEISRPQANGAPGMLPGFCLGTGTRYIAMPEPVGTTQPRNRVFEEAKGDVVMCVDSHVMLRAGALARLRQHYEQNPADMDLHSGPILWDGLKTCGTHYADMWRGEMWGIWSQAWLCRCALEPGPMAKPGEPETTTMPWYARPLQDAMVFDVVQHVYPDQRAHYAQMAMGLPALTPCPRCGALPPPLPFAGHEDALKAAGYYKLGLDPNDPAFEVPGQGLGLFACRKDAWLGFNKEFRGFGGEEMYIHEKYRAIGRKVWCHPWLGWWHRFGRVGGAPYPLPRGYKVRNYILGALELPDTAAREARIAATRKHFVEDLKVTPVEQWNAILADPHNEKVPPECATCLDNPSGRALPPIEAMDDPQKILAWVVTVPRDLEQHAPQLADLAAQGTVAVEFSGRRESTVGLLAGVARSNGRLISFNTETDRLLSQMAAAWPQHLSLASATSDGIASIEPCDLLFLDSSPHTFDIVYGELKKYSPNVRRYIVLHDTASFGVNGEAVNSQVTRGLHAAMQQWLTENPAWFVVSHTNNQYGLTVLGCNPTDKPENPVYPWPRGYGPGTELLAIMKDLGIEATPGCTCRATALKMDEWGVAGCRIEENYNFIINTVKNNAGGWGWQEAINNRVKAGWNALVKGYLWKINPTDPIPSLVDLGIDRAESKGYA